MAKHYLKLSEVLQKLLYDKRMNASELAREVDLPTPTVHRMVTGKSTRPYRSSLQPIADYFSISVDQLLGEDPLPDTTQGDSFPASNGKVIELPLLEWKDLKADLSTIHAKKTVIATNDLSPKCFAVIMNDSSMEPHFPEGTVLILDPNKEVYDRSYVLVQLSKNNILIFRQLLIDAEDQFLKPLNPELSSFKMRLMEKGDKILASLVEARQTYGKS